MLQYGKTAGGHALEAANNGSFAFKLTAKVITISLVVARRNVIVLEVKEVLLIWYCGLLINGRQ